ncbi:uncharacterized protein FIBRA_09109 [Fibroporia radiculosa]|uniref:Heterokaryon incompatibility domain-containing protein n=1 Tax=Fibroporia radiculosa TaxID=599839 RepID=J4GIX0_9APHY|nr:uncharacterized protein FIBRA_09109 [Fibroporia radiculosa]CCM06808.1 predicted protein [Fibroporia radiculosa]
MLCSACTPIFQSNPKFSFGPEDLDFVWHNHQKTAAGLRNAAKQGCYICSAFWDGMTGQFSFDPEANESESFTRYSLSDAWSYAPEGTCELLIYSDMVGGDGQPFVRQFVVEAGDFEGTSRMEDDAETPSSTSSEASFGLAKQWLAKCLRDHSTCRSIPDKDPWIPTRLLDVGSSESEEDTRLVITNNLSPYTLYMTLSHCWGSAQIVQLRTATLDSMQDRIPLSSLPQTFRDAIFVVKQFEIRYLWIDSLCIIQDSMDDWQHEAARMAFVYKNSYCNVAATGSSNSHGGCFALRLPSIVRPCLVEATWDGGVTGSVRVIDLGMWTDGVSGAPLNKRAWVVQERLLAPRVLHFSTRQIFWECFELDACETYPSGIPQAFYAGSAGFKHLSPAIDHASLRSSPRWTPDPAWRLYHTWNWIVSAYMKCGLTKAQDKLIALSGIASEMQRLTEDEYLAGLWRMYVPYQLLWFIESRRQSNGEGSFRPAPYRAPSWSWASVEGEVNTTSLNNPNSASILVSVLNAHVTLVRSENKTGQTKGGFLILRGHLSAAGWKPDSEGEGIVLVVNDAICGQIHADEATDLPAYGLFCVPILRHVSEGKALLDVLILHMREAERTFERIGVVLGSDAEEMLLIDDEQDITLI